MARLILIVCVCGVQLSSALHACGTKAHRTWTLADINPGHKVTVEYTLLMYRRACKAKCIITRDSAVEVAVVVTPSRAQAEQRKSKGV